MHATSIEELKYERVLLEQEIETQEGGPSNRARIIGRLHSALEYVNNALKN
jgi:hypothetical protein